jgi:hypothetical protein
MNNKNTTPPNGNTMNNKNTTPPPGIGQPRRAGPMGHGGPMAMMKGEKPRDFKGTMAKLISYLGSYKLAIRDGFCHCFYRIFNCRTKNSWQSHH